VGNPLCVARDGSLARVNASFPPFLSLRPPCPLLFVSAKVTLSLVYLSVIPPFTRVTHYRPVNAESMRAKRVKGCDVIGIQDFHVV